MSDEKETKDEVKEDQDEEILKNAQDVFASLLLSESLADVHFSVKGKDGKTERIPGHRLVLASKSLVFQALLYSLEIEKDGTHSYNPNKALDKDIVIEGVEPDSFRRLLAAAYLDEFELTQDDKLEDLISLAKTFQVDSLRLAVVAYMEGEVTAENACKRFEEGRKLLNEASFGLKYIEENASAVFKSEDFTELSRESLAILLKSNNLAIDEVEVIAAVLRWADAECKRQSKKSTAENKKEVIGDLFYQIRFTEMSMSDIVSTVQPSGILPQEDLLALFTYIGASKDNKPSTKFNTKPREGAGAFLKSVILRPEHHKILQNYYDKTKPSKWKRIFHGLEDGMNSSSFHAKCDNVTPTMVICKSTNGNIFGGYTQYSWSSGSYKTDSAAFLFSLVNSHKKPFKQVSTSDSYSIYAYSSYGPTWGGGHNLCIHSDFRGTSNYSNGSYSSYRMEDTSNGITVSNDTYAGSYNFSLTDIEVFTLDKK